MNRRESPSSTDLGFVTLGLLESGCKFALSPPTVGRKMQICTLIHTNLESQIPSLLMNKSQTPCTIARDGHARSAFFRVREAEGGPWFVRLSIVQACVALANDEEGDGWMRNDLLK